MRPKCTNNTLFFSPFRQNSESVYVGTPGDKTFSLLNTRPEHLMGNRKLQYYILKKILRKTATPGQSIAGNFINIRQLNTLLCSLSFIFGIYLLFWVSCNSTPALLNMSLYCYFAFSSYFIMSTCPNSFSLAPKVHFLTFPGDLLSTRAAIMGLFGILLCMKHIQNKLLCHLFHLFCIRAFSGTNVW